jgi:preprotein translocase subunit YajC
MSIFVLAQAAQPGLSNATNGAGASQDAAVRIDSVPMDANSQAVSTVPGSPTKSTDAPPRSGGSYMSLLLMVLVFVVMYVLLFRGPRKQQQQQKHMIQTLKKNDRVRTIGGIYGTVMDVRGDEVVLKIDESTNTRIHLSTSAIGKNLSQDEKA